jgi:hypothetical protein
VGRATSTGITSLSWMAIDVEMPPLFKPEPAINPVPTSAGRRERRREPNLKLGVWCLTSG